MKIRPYIEKLNNSQEYKKFKSQYADAYLVAGFFVLDLESGKNIHQVDFYVPSKKKIAAFTLDNNISIQLLDAMNNKMPSTLDINTNIDLDAIPGILEDEMKNRGITENIKKIIAIIQNIDGEEIWNINCVLSGMSILKAHVEDNSKTVLKMEKSSIMDYVKKLPVPQQMEAAKTPEGIKKEIKKLDRLEETIEKEKKHLKKELKDEDSDKNKKKN